MIKNEISKKTIQRRRIMRYFVEATYEIIREEGLEAATIRKISDKAGYNSATLYNYFSSLDNLIAFSSLCYLKDYSEDLKSHIEGYESSLDKYFKIWKCFCIHSFRNPDIYHKIFFKELSSSLSTSIREYYSIFPEYLQANEIQEFREMLRGETINERTRVSLESCIRDGFFAKEDEQNIAEISILIYEGMLDKIRNGIWKKSIEDASEKVIYHMRRSLQAYLLP